MEIRAWREVLDRYLETNQISADDYAQLEDEQIVIIQEIKRSLKRIAYKNESENRN